MSQSALATPNRDVFTVSTKDGDVFLLCSDGLTDMVQDVDILDLVDRNRGDLEKAVRALVQFANKEGGDDNITAVAFRIDAGGSAEPVGEDTMTMPAISEVPPPAEIELRGRARLVVTVLVLLAIAVALLVWGLTR